MTELVRLYGEKISTTSMVVADTFGKRHDNVLRDIENLDCSEEFKLLNFEEANYKLRGNTYRYYFITRDGFSFLAMGYTGAKAAKFKEAFIKAFNRMEHALKVATTPVLLPVYQSRILSDPAKSCPDNRWCIFDQASEIMLFIEKEVGSICQYDLADGSIGMHWAKHREDKPWAKTVSYYYHEFNDKRGTVQSKCYQYSELEYFKVWLKKIYKKTLLYPYLYNKFKKDKLMLPRVEALKPKLIGTKAV
ncbi:MAG: Rha family transcriptional regulator [Chitinophagales bacterium]|nr:Rha family transcriptional regulator [Chitinophagales bacterium]